MYSLINIGLIKQQLPDVLTLSCVHIAKTQERCKNVELKI